MDDARIDAYIRAAAEIDAAMRADFSLSQREVARRIGKSQSTVSKLLKWYREDTYVQIRAIDLLQHATGRDD